MNLTLGIYLYIALAVERVLHVAFVENYVSSSPTIGIFLYISLRLNTLTAGSCSACVYNVFVWDPGWLYSCLVSWVVWGVICALKFTALISDFETSLYIYFLVSSYLTLLYFKNCAYLTDDGGYEKRNVHVLRIIKSQNMKGCIHSIKSGFFQFSAK